MELKLYNTLTKTKEVFKPLDAKNVRLYVCGPTVYDYAHIGNARPVIVFDVLFRLLRHIYGESHVTYVRNITDIDDKINARAAEEGVSIRELTERTNAQYQHDVAALGCLRPTHQPRATDHIPQMITMIEALIAAGHAYVAEGHVLYDVTSKPDYGKLARRSLDEMLAGARVEVAPYKKGPMDFVLWKPSGPELPGWESPWGRGRPGWHIECSAMSKALLGETFDIHGGGIDLVFPHHENEIAQSEGAHHGHPLAKLWMHNGFLQVEGEKMSKSLGNFVTIRQLMENWNGVGWPGEALRFNMLQTHYRQPMDWTFEALNESHQSLWDWAGLIEAHGAVATQLAEPVIQALTDDLNTHQAVAALHALKKKRDWGGLLASLKLLGFSGRRDVLARFHVATGEAHGRATVTGVGASINLSEGKAHGRATVIGVGAPINRSEIDRLVAARFEARSAKDFAEADRIRAELEAMGVVLKDGPEGTVWELKR
jgi:cysteinyl-tRNA synthetase